MDDQIETMPFEIEINVIFRDIDALGHVNNAVYFTYLETARTRFFVEKLALSNVMELPVIVAEATCTFKSAARFGEHLRIGMGVSRIGQKSFDLLYEIRAETGRLVATAKTVMVTYEYASRKAIKIPDELRGVLESTMVDSTTVSSL
jgi:acyl-CoA thioester hydrolase